MFDRRNIGSYKIIEYIRHSGLQILLKTKLYGKLLKQNYIYIYIRAANFTLWPFYAQEKIPVPTG
jgi:hypothetical protein